MLKKNRTYKTFFANEADDGTGYNECSSQATSVKGNSIFHSPRSQMMSPKVDQTELLKNSQVSSRFSITNDDNPDINSSK